MLNKSWRANTMPKKNDIGLKIGTKEEALWMEVRDAQVEKIEDLEKQLIFCKEVLKLAKNKILLEQRK